MSQQLPLGYPAAYVGREGWNQEIEAIRAAVRHLGLKEVAFACDVGGTHLSDAMNERERKVWHPHWTHTIKSMLERRHGDEIAAELLRAMLDADVSVTPQYVISEAVTLTPEEEAQALRRELAKFGEAGKAAIARVRGKAGRK